LPLHAVERVFMASTVMDVPGSPSVLEGLVRIGNDVVPVISMRRRLQQPSRKLSPEDFFVLVRSKDARVVLHVDNVGDVVSLPVRGTGTPVGGISTKPLFEGVAVMEDGVVLVQDLERFLSEWERNGVRRAVRNAKQTG